MAGEQLRRIEAEMAKFEREIGNRGPGMRPPLPGMGQAPVGMVPRAAVFTPHSVRVRPSGLPPVVGMPQMAPFAGGMPSHFPISYGQGLGLPPGVCRRPTAGRRRTFGIPGASPARYWPRDRGGTDSILASGRRGGRQQWTTRSKRAAAAGGQDPTAASASKQAAASSSSSPAPGMTKSGSVTALASDIAAMESKRQSESAAQQRAAVAGAWRRKAEKSQNPYLRLSGGEMWVDHNLAEWDPDDFRLFCGDLGNEVNDELLAKTFRRYPSFQKAKVVRDKKSGKSRGFGFVSFKNPEDFIRAMREMNGKYVGNHPIKLKKSDWKERQYDTAVKKHKMKKKLGLVSG